MATINTTDIQEQLTNIKDWNGDNRNRLLAQQGELASLSAIIETALEANTSAVSDCERIAEQADGIQAVIDTANLPHDG